MCLSGSLATSGCLFGIGGPTGVNKTLKLRNNTEKEVQIHVVVERNEPAGSQNRETVFEKSVSIPPNQTTTRDVLGDYQFIITVTGLGQEMEFGTRPICNEASTTITVTEAEEIRDEVEGCE